MATLVQRPYDHPTTKCRLREVRYNEYTISQKVRPRIPLALVVGRSYGLCTNVGSGPETLNPVVKGTHGSFEPMRLLN
eukprot:1160910-Pelagomonas_calceolata.AAC.2